MTARKEDFIMKALRFLFPLLLLSIPAHATPREVMIIRHAEKPADKRATNLSPKGYERAKALVTVFGGSRFRVPEIIFAQSPRKKSGSLRPIETVTPLAKSLGLEVNERFQVKRGDDLADYLLRSEECDGKVVLVSWGSDEIPEIAEDLGARSFDEEWPKDSFDRVWRIEFSGSKVAKEEDLPMKALPGDSR